jgi:hypothetical protein
MARQCGTEPPGHPAAARPAIAQLRHAKGKISAALLRPDPTNRTAAARASDPACNVVGVGVGERYAGGRPTGVHAITILVRHKLPAVEVPAEHVLPASIDGCRTDVVESGGFGALCATTARMQIGDVVRPGVWVRAGLDGPHGTIGAVVHAGSTAYLLSTRVVLAAGADSQVSSLVRQNGAEVRWFPVGRLVRAVPFGAVNCVDCALAEFDTEAAVDAYAPLIGCLNGAGSAAVDAVVHKVGAATGYTAGRVISVDTDVLVDEPSGPRVMAGQILVRGLDRHPFAGAGDSGALLFERRTGVAVGMLVAGSGPITVANHLTDVLDALGVALGASASSDTGPSAQPAGRSPVRRAAMRPFRPALPVVAAGRAARSAGSGEITNTAQATREDVGPLDAVSTGRTRRLAP